MNEISVFNIISMYTLLFVISKDLNLLLLKCRLVYILKMQCHK